jgi:hypothetical protein
MKQIDGNPIRRKKRFCKNPDCFDFETGKRARLNRKQKKFCSVSCAGVYRRGRNTNGKNYVRIRLDGERIYLHRYVMEQKLGRKLLPTEIVHHIDYNPFNNDESNLMVFESNYAHLEFHRLNPYPPGREAEMIAAFNDEMEFWFNRGDYERKNLQSAEHQL